MGSAAKRPAGSACFQPVHCGLETLSTAQNAASVADNRIRRSVCTLRLWTKALANSNGFLEVTHSRIGWLHMFQNVERLLQVTQGRIGVRRNSPEKISYLNRFHGQVGWHAIKTPLNLADLFS